MLRASGVSQHRIQHGSTSYVRLFAPIIVCLFLLAALFVFLLLQGDMNDWVAFMGGEASMALFALYCIVGVAGISVVALWKKELRILDASGRLLKFSFLATIVVGCCVFTYLNFSATQTHYEWMHDGIIYQQMGQSFLQNYEFIVDSRYTHHLGPIYPIYLSVFYAFLPVHLATQVAVEVIFALSAIVVFVITRKLYGTAQALVTTALVATVPSYLFSVSRNYSEPLVLIMYTLTIYFIIESLNAEKANRIIFAGICAGIGFLTKSGIGYFFLITGIVGFLWRFYYMKWRVLKNKNYVVAIVVFLIIVLTWTVRNLCLFWDGTFLNFFVASQSSDYFYKALVHSITRDFGSFFVQFWFFATLTILFLLSYVWVFFDYIKSAAGKIREERTSCLLLAIVLPLLITWIVGAIYFVYENEWMADYLITYYPVSQVRFLVFALIRYCFIVLVPLSWLAYEQVNQA